MKKYLVAVLTLSVSLCFSNRDKSYYDKDYYKFLTNPNIQKRIDHLNNWEKPTGLFMEDTMSSFAKRLDRAFSDDRHARKPKNKDLPLASEVGHFGNIRCVGWRVYNLYRYEFDPDEFKFRTYIVGRTNDGKLITPHIMSDEEDKIPFYGSRYLSSGRQFGRMLDFLKIEAKQTGPDFSFVNKEEFLSQIENVFVTTTSGAVKAANRARLEELSDFVNELEEEAKQKLAQLNNHAGKVHDLNNAVGGIISSRFKTQMSSSFVLNRDGARHELSGTYADVTAVRKYVSYKLLELEDGRPYTIFKSGKTEFNRILASGISKEVIPNDHVDRDIGICYPLANKKQWPIFIKFIDTYYEKMAWEFDTVPVLKSTWAKMLKREKPDPTNSFVPGNGLVDFFKETARGRAIFEAFFQLDPKAVEQSGLGKYGSALLAHTADTIEKNLDSFKDSKGKIATLWNINMWNRNRSVKKVRDHLQAMKKIIK